jgi:hypothetical protein
LVNSENTKSGGAPFDPHPLLQHTVGNLVYSIVFGKEYEIDDPIWKWLQHLQEEGTKMIGVAGPMNFLPWLRCVRRAVFTSVFADVIDPFQVRSQVQEYD